MEETLAREVAGRKKRGRVTIMPDSLPVWLPTNVPAGGGKSGSPTHNDTTASPLASIFLVMAWISMVLLTATELSKGLSRLSLPSLLPLPSPPAAERALEDDVMADRVDVEVDGERGTKLWAPCKRTADTITNGNSNVGWK